MNKDLKKILWTIKSCAMDYEKQEEGMHTFEWSELWVLNEYIKELQQKVNQLETNRDEAIEYIKNHIHQETYTGYMDAKELMKLVSLLERGKE